MQATELESTLTRPKVQILDPGDDASPDLRAAYDGFVERAKEIDEDRTKARQRKDDVKQMIASDPIQAVPEIGAEMFKIELDAQRREMALRRDLRPYAKHLRQRKLDGRDAAKVKTKGMCDQFLKALGKQGFNVDKMRSGTRPDGVNKQVSDFIEEYNDDYRHTGYVASSVAPDVTEENFEMENERYLKRGLEQLESMLNVHAGLG